MQEQAFRVNDCYVPALVCRGDRIYNLEPVLEPNDIDGDGIVEEAAVLVEAVDLARCNFQDCSGNLTFSVNRVGEPADREQSTMFLDCQDRYSVQLELYVWDETFNPFSVQPDGTVGGNNWRRCEVTVYVQDPSLVCNDCAVADNVTLNGAINTMNGEPMTAITVIAGGDAGTTQTNAFGVYQLGGTIGSTYELQAENNADPREGISTLDILILQYHLLGLQPITDPYMRLAADVNRDGVLSALDIIALQGLVLSREEFYPEGSPWRFVPANWDGAGNPPEMIVLEEVQDCSFDHDFIGIKLGDLNNTLGTFDRLSGTANAGARDGSLVAGVGRSRPEALVAADVELTVGQEVTVALRTAEGAAFVGGQAGFTWNRQALTLLDFQSTDLASQNFHQRGNQLLVSW
ncbi:MAG: dockerin type I domain-containing protein, partial [Bacteroidota bacterium]